jgi:hypothetical protein
VLALSAVSIRFMRLAYSHYMLLRLLLRYYTPACRLCISSTFRRTGGRFSVR